MKRLSLLIAGAMTLALPASVMAWHVDTEPQETKRYITIKAKLKGPYEDPLYYIVAKTSHVKTKVKRQGRVCVPDARWVRDYALIVRGTGVVVPRGQCRAHPPGSYVGDWVSPTRGRYAREVERFTIHQDVVPAVSKLRKTVTWKYHGHNGWTTYTRTLGPSCKHKSAPRWVKGDTVQRLNGKPYLTAPPGFYKALPKYQRGTVCR